MTTNLARSESLLSDDLPSHAVAESRLCAIGRAATGALYDELALYPKPGLVSFVDSGSHHDMNAGHFMRSLFALRHYFKTATYEGAKGCNFTALECHGRAAEQAMLQATGGVNTHRGAIFSLGLLCAAAGGVLADGYALTDARLRQLVIGRWGAEIDARRRRPRASNGQRAARAFGLRGIEQEAAEGFPTLFEVSAPALRASLNAGLGMADARLQCLMATIAALDDTNLAHRGGLTGLRWTQRQAQDFLDAGGVHRPQGRDEACALHAAFVQRHLSPGGAADLLAIACWLVRAGVRA
jgi:triphosphoribosyl-dephospho-CoA synthase